MKIPLLPIILAAVLALSPACSRDERAALPTVGDFELPEITEIKHIRAGFAPGPYGDMFSEAILPSLKKMGYTATLVQYDDYQKPNIALERGEIDLNIFQHYIYLNNFKFEHDLRLTAIMEIPTVSMGIFSNKFKYIGSLSRGITVAVPNDVSNLARALRVLESARIISLNPYIDKSKATLGDIDINPYSVRITPVDAHRLVESLKTHDIAVINGNFAISGGLKPSKALYNEVLAENYVNVVAVRTADLNKRFVRDIVNVVLSDDFRSVIADTTGNFAGFQRPRGFYDKTFEAWRPRR